MSEAPATSWRARGRHIGQLVAAYVALMKPSIILLLLVTTVAAMLIAADEIPPLSLVLITLLGGTLGAGGANAINHYLDRDIDGVMGRTARRPIPAGLVTPEDALRFGIALGAASFLLLSLLVNLLSALLTMAALAFYVFVYTGWLKRTTVHNIVIGGAAGAMPPLIGWAAVTGEIAALPLLLFAIIFVWTPPHFWALSLLIRDDYARAGIPMLPVVQGEAATRRQILLYSVALVILSAVASLVGLLGPLYLVAALVLGGLFVWYAIALYKEQTRPAARRLFLYSLSYLALLFGAMVLDRRIPMP